MDKPDNVTPQPSPRRSWLPERKPLAGVPEVLKQFENAPPDVKLEALRVCVVKADWPYLVMKCVVALACLALTAWRVWLSQA